jgi:hypothetical protein
MSVKAFIPGLLKIVCCMGDAFLGGRTGRVVPMRQPTTQVPAKNKESFLGNIKKISGCSPDWIGNLILRGCIYEVYGDSMEGAIG